MKKFRFTLQGILNARAAQKEAIELELKAAQQRLATEELALRQLISRITELLNSEMAIENPSGADFLLRERYLNGLKRKRKEQQVKRDAADAAIKVCIAKLKAADIELKKIEKLYDREKENWSAEYQREEQKLSDEIGMTLNFYQPHH